jgi:anti-sigma factor RsiW
MISPEMCVEREQLFAFAHRMLDPQEESRVSAHLASCAACRDAVSDYQRLHEVLDEWKPVTPSPWFDARARARVRSQASARPAVSLWSLAWARWATVMAVVALVAVSSIWLLRGRATRTESPARTATAAASSPAQPARSQAAPGSEGATVGQQQAVKQEMDLYKNLPVLENYDMLANFDVLSELPQAEDKSSD